MFLQRVDEFCLGCLWHTVCRIHGVAELLVFWMARLFKNVDQPTHLTKQLQLDRKRIVMFFHWKSIDLAHVGEHHPIAEFFHVSVSQRLDGCLVFCRDIENEVP